MGKDAKTPAKGCEEICEECRKKREFEKTNAELTGQQKPRKGES